MQSLKANFNKNASFNSNNYYTDNYRLGAGILVNVSFILRQWESNPINVKQSLKRVNIALLSKLVMWVTS